MTQGEKYRYDTLSLEQTELANTLTTPHFRGGIPAKDINSRNASTADLKFDYNYIACYFIPVIKKLESSFNF